MDAVPRSGRWRCPACGTGLDPVSASTYEQRLACPGCGGQFRVRRKQRGGSDSSFTVSGEVPAARTPATVGGFGLAARGLALGLVRGAYSAGNLAGSALVFVLGGFVPVVGGWLRDEVSDRRSAFASLGGVTIADPSKDPDADLGPAITRTDAPALFTEVAEVAKKLGARPPDQVRLTYLPCCGVVAWDRSRALILGLPLLHVLDRSELRAVLAHELAHLARGDATLSADRSRFVHGLGRALDSAPPSRSPLRLWARLCRRLSETLHAPIARGMEARADRASGSIAGGDAAASALVKVAAVQPLFREVLDGYAPGGPETPNLYAFFREFWSRLPEGLLTAIRHQLLTDGEAPTDPAHPPLLERIALVQTYPIKPGGEADRTPAAGLLGDVEAMERMLHNRLFGVAAVEPSVFHRAGS